MGARQLAHRSGRRARHRRPHASRRRARDRCGRGRLRADSPPAGRWPSCAWAASGTWTSRRSRSAANVAGRAGLDGSPRRVVHGLAVRRLGDQPRRLSSRWVRAPCARRPAWNASCSRSSATRRTRRAACSCSNRARCRPPMWPRGWRDKAGVAPGALTFAVAPDREHRRRRADRRARHRDRPAQDGHDRLRRARAS